MPPPPGHASKDSNSVMYGVGSAGKNTRLCWRGRRDFTLGLGMQGWGSSVVFSAFKKHNSRCPPPPFSMGLVIWGKIAWLAGLAWPGLAWPTLPSWLCSCLFFLTKLLFLCAIPFIAHLKVSCKWTVTYYRYFKQQQFAVCPVWIIYMGRQAVPLVIISAQATGIPASGPVHLLI